MGKFQDHLHRDCVMMAKSSKIDVSVKSSRVEFRVSSNDEWDMSTHTVSGVRVGEDDSSNNRKVEDQIQQSSNLEVLFLFISFGYMLPWTSLGSLISYYKHTYSANFYVKLYCCYYLPGLPVALLQHQYDGVLDSRYGSRMMYMWRGVGAFLCMFTILLSMVWLDEQYELLALFVTLGVCGWLCHGTASMLAAMHTPAAIAYLQTGFRCPEIYTIAAVALLQIGKVATVHHLHLFYIVSANVVLVGLISWVIVVRSSASQSYFAMKDETLYGDNPEQKPLLRPSHDIHSKKNEANTREKNNSEDNLDGGDDVRVDVGETFVDDFGNKKGNSSLYSFQIARAKLLLRAIETTMMRTSGQDAVWPLCLALVITIFCSIFQASFFAYVDSPDGRDIEQILYFVRLFSDLLGRPLTRMPRPWFLKVTVLQT